MKALVICITNFILVLVLSLASSAQNLSNMSIEKRDSCLHEIAKEVILKYGEERFYKEITTYTVESTIWEKEPDGKSYEGYILTYYYDTTKFKMRKPYLVKVHIYKQTGKVRIIDYGQRLLRIVDMAGYTRKEKDDEIVKVKFRTYSPPKTKNGEVIIVE